MTPDDDRLPPVPPLDGTERNGTAGSARFARARLVESLLQAERRRAPPTARQRRALWRRTHRTLLATGVAMPALLAGRLGAAMRAGGAAKTVVTVVASVVAAASLAAGVAIGLRPRGEPSHFSVEGPGPALARPVPSAPAPLPSPAGTPPSPPPSPSQSPPVVVARTSSRGAEAAATAATGDLEREAALIDRARAALGSGEVLAAGRALAGHARQFPAGIFREEREALEVLVRARAGREAQARTAAGRFRARYPHSVFLPLVTAAVKEPAGQR